MQQNKQNKQIEQGGWAEWAKCTWAAGRAATPFTEARRQTIDQRAACPSSHCVQRSAPLADTGYSLGPQLSAMADRPTHARGDKNKACKKRRSRFEHACPATRHWDAVQCRRCPRLAPMPGRSHTLWCAAGSPADQVSRTASAHLSSQSRPVRCSACAPPPTCAPADRAFDPFWWHKAGNAGAHCCLLLPLLAPRARAQGMRCSEQAQPRCKRMPRQPSPRPARNAHSARAHSAAPRGRQGQRVCAPDWAERRAPGRRACASASARPASTAAAA